MSPISKCHVLMVRGGIHGSPGILGILLADLFEAKTVECFWGWVNGRIHAYGLGGDADGGVSGDGEAVGEGVGFGDEAFKGDCSLA